MPDQIYVAPIVAENDSGVKGVAVFTLSDDALQVDVTATGLEPGEAHPMHIHGFSDDTPSDPTTANDDDGDGFIETPEGVQAIGPILLPLVEQDATGGDGGDDGAADNFAAADENGTLRFSETFTDSNDFVAQLLEGTASLEGRAVEIHGLTVDGDAGDGTPGEVDGTAGYKALLPVGGGVIEPLSEASLADLIGGASTSTDNTDDTADEFAAGTA